MSAVGRDVAAVALLKVAVSVAVLAVGFRAVSDDDFARVVIAEQWAHAPKLDPSGTSWLPAPFWVSGAAMLVFGRSLEVARATAFALGVGAIAVVLVAARWIGGADARGAAIAGAVIAAVFPWSARLGVATVPELPTAALMLLATAALVPPTSGSRRLWGAIAIFVATLSRYEAWPVALVFAGFTAVDLARTRGDRGRLALAAALALAGPASWIAWNRWAHGDALHFLARVTAYRQALGGTGEPGGLSRVVAYPAAMLREEPELVAMLALSVFAFVVSSAGVVWLLSPIASQPAPKRSVVLHRFARPAVAVVVQIAALSLAMVKDGAPTHHPERAILLAFLVVALAAGHLAVKAASATNAMSWWWQPVLGCAAIAAIGGAVLVRSRMAHEPLAGREDETAVGLSARQRATPSAKVLVEIADYGYFAVLAAFGRPEDAVLDRSIDPRGTISPSSFDDADALRARINQAGATLVVARVSAVTAAVLGAPVARDGTWGVFAAKPR